MRTTIDALDISYEDEGKGEPVLLLHGIPTASFIWRHQIEALAPHFRVVAPDLPGWGSSAKPADFDYTISSYAEFVSAFLTELGLERVILVVHDLGGAIGLAFLGRYPERVSKLVALDTFAYVRALQRLPWLLYRYVYPLPVLGDRCHRVVWDLAVRRTNAFVSLALHDKRLVTPALVERYRELNRDTRLTDKRILLANDIDGITGPVEWNARNVRVPALILWAENDALFPLSSARRLQRTIPGSILQTIPNCGHFLQEERPDEVNRQILAFLTSPPVPEGGAGRSEEASPDAAAGH